MHISRAASGRFSCANLLPEAGAKRRAKVTVRDNALKRKSRNLHIYHTLWPGNAYANLLNARTMLSGRRGIQRHGHTRKSAEARFTDCNSSLPSFSSPLSRNVSSALLKRRHVAFTKIYLTPPPPQFVLRAHHRS